MRTVALIGLALVLISIPGCCPKAKAGDSCSSENSEQCVDDKNALVCHVRKLETMSCRGPQGCTRSRVPPCDESVAVEAERCNAADKSACDLDGKTMLTCKGYKWTLNARCRGPKACQTDGTKVLCDTSAAEAGDPCSAQDESTSECSVDKKSMLSCKGGVYVPANKCLGQKGCRREANKILCDATIGDIGDPCAHSGHACSTDRKAILECKGGKLVMDTDCKKKSCVHNPDDTLQCK